MIVTYNQDAANKEKIATPYENFTYDTTSNGGCLNKFIELSRIIENISNDVNNLGTKYGELQNKYEKFTEFNDRMNSNKSSLLSSIEGIRKEYDEIIKNLDQQVASYCKTDSSFINDVESINKMLSNNGGGSSSGGGSASGGGSSAGGSNIPSGGDSNYNNPNANVPGGGTNNPNENNNNGYPPSNNDNSGLQDNRRQQDEYFIEYPSKGYFDKNDGNETGTIQPIKMPSDDEIGATIQPIKIPNDDEIGATIKPIRIPNDIIYPGDNEEIGGRILPIDGPGGKLDYPERNNDNTGPVILPVEPFDGFIKYPSKDDSGRVILPVQPSNGEIKFPTKDGFDKTIQPAFEWGSPQDNLVLYKNNDDKIGATIQPIEFSDRKIYPEYGTIDNNIKPVIPSDGVTFERDIVPDRVISGIGDIPVDVFHK